MGSVSRTFWPYDEVRALTDTDVELAVLATPWLKVRLRLPENDRERAHAFLGKLAANTLAVHDRDDVNWFFASLANYPLAYILPRKNPFGSDEHQVLESAVDLHSPSRLLLSLTDGSAEDAAVRDVAKRRMPEAWSWDATAALAFSESGDQIDPISLFSVVRRFHLLNDVESNRTAEMIAFVGGLENSARFRSASALVLRQNHYITEQCEAVLREALPIAMSARPDVADFIQAESGHDSILAKALLSLGTDPVTIEVIPVAKALMEVFRHVARRNLLGFAMVVDIFERTSYRDEDPVTTMLNEGGERSAGRQIDAHRQINDAGGHENVALGFLEEMAPVDAAYAFEALRLAELATLVIHQLSAETLEFLERGM